MGVVMMETRTEEERRLEAEERRKHEERHYNTEILKGMRLRFLRDCRRKEYKALWANGSLDEELEASARRCREYAKSLIESGTFYALAWSMAVRSVLLESESD